MKKLRKRKRPYIVHVLRESRSDGRDLAVQQAGVEDGPRVPDERVVTSERAGLERSTGGLEPDDVGDRCREGLPGLRVVRRGPGGAESVEVGLGEGKCQQGGQREVYKVRGDGGTSLPISTSSSWTLES